MNDNCKRCDAPIMFVATAKGRVMPLDPEPVAEGNVVIREGVAYVNATPLPGEKRYVSHFVTCPAASSFRRAR